MEKEKKGGRKKKKRMASLDSLMLTSAIFLMVRAAGQIKTGRDRWLICIQRRD